MYLAVNHLDNVRIDIQDPMPTSVQEAKPHNKERSYKKFLQGISSEKWFNQLQLQAHNPASRLRTYVFLHLDDTRRMQLYKPAPYLSLCTAAYQLDLFRVRTQGCTDCIPSHMYYGKYTARAQYDQRYCPQGGPGFGTGQEQLGPSCSGHGILKARGLKNHAQTASGSSASLISMRF